MPQPLELDEKNIPWKIPLKQARSLQGIVSINMIHDARRTCTIALFKGAGKFLKSYFFDNSLKMQLNFWGIINLVEVSNESKNNSFLRRYYSNAIK